MFLSTRRLVQIVIQLPDCEPPASEVQLITETVSYSEEVEDIAALFEVVRVAKHRDEVFISDVVILDVRFSTNAVETFRRFASFIAVESRTCHCVGECLVFGDAVEVVVLDGEGCAADGFSAC